MGAGWSGWARPRRTPYYGENVATVRAALEAYAPLLGDDPLALEAILARLARTLGRNAAARASIDMALHDLAGQLTGLPLWRWWGLERNAGPLTSFTIGIAEPTVVAQRAKAAAAAGFPLLKIKLGSGDLAQDRAILSAVREARAHGSWWTPTPLGRRRRPCSSAPTSLQPASSYWSSRWQRATSRGWPTCTPTSPCR